MYCLGIYYNTALIGIETNFSTYPNKVLEEEYEYPNLYVREKEDDYTGKLEKRYGFRTDRNTRPLILAELQRIINEEPESITDVEIFKEALTFVKNEKGRPEAQEGSHDDLVMGTAITYYIRDQQKTRVENTQSVVNENVFYSFDNDKKFKEDYGETIEVI